MNIAPLPKDLVSDAVAPWTEAGLTRPWNDPVADCDRALVGPDSNVLAAWDDAGLAATAMIGHDGHRGWAYAALLPVAVGIVLAAGTSAVLAPYVQYLRGSRWLPPTWSWILLGSGAAIVLTLAVALGSNITLRTTTVPSAFRTE